MAIEAVAGDSIVQPGDGAAGDIGAGPMTGDDSFTLPDSFEDNIDDGISVPEETPVDGVAAPSPRPSPGAAAPPAPAAGQTPVQQQTPAAAQPAPAQPAPQPVAQPQGATPQGGGAERRIYSPGELAQQLGQNRTTMIDALAAQKFQLSPAEVQALEVDAVGVLPKIMARVYFEATVNGLQQMANMVPRMVEYVANERLAENQAESDFHTEWPNIDRNNAQHMRTVAQLAQSFRQMNPGASQADAVKYVGQAATAFLGLQAPQRAAAPGARPGNGARRTAPPFAPATGGRAQPMPGQTPAPQPGDAFAGLGLNFDDA